MTPCAGPPRMNAASTSPEPHPRRPGVLRRATTHVMRPTTMATHRTASGATNEVATAVRLPLLVDNAAVAGSGGVTARPRATTPAPSSVPPARTAPTRRPPPGEGVTAARTHAPRTAASALTSLRKY